MLDERVYLDRCPRMVLAEKEGSCGERSSSAQLGKGLSR